MTIPSSSSKRRYHQATVLVAFLGLLAYLHVGNSFSQTQICNNPTWRRWNENTDKSHSRCVDTSIRSGLKQDNNDFTVTGSPNPTIKWQPPEDDPRILPPLNQLVDVNVNRRAVVYEVILSRESIMGIEIVQGKVGATVGSVVSGSKAQQLGILEGDLIVATSATAGDSLWTHDNAESIKSAINTRFVMSPTVKLRLERSLADIDEEILAVLKVPYTATVKLKRPIGLHVVEGPGKQVYVQSVKAELSAARSRRVEVGDQIVAMSASWGDRMWEVTSVESFVLNVRTRRDSQLSFQLKRMVPLDVFTGQVAGRQQRLLLKREETMSRRGPDYNPDNSYMRPGELVQGEEEQVNVNSNPAPHAASTAAAAAAAAVDAAAAASGLGQQQQQQQQQYGATQKGGYKLPNAVYGSLIQAIDATTQGDTLHALWQGLYRGDIPGETLNVYLANKMMSAALKLELPDLAVDIFEASFGFHHNEELDLNDTVNETTTSSSNSNSVDEECLLEIVYSSSSEQPQTPIDCSIDTAAADPVPVPNQDTSRGSDVILGDSKPISAYFSFSFLEPNNFVCTTAVKAYGRKGQVSKALAVLPWVEAKGVHADTYLMSALLFVCAKTKRVSEAEKLFWRDIPARNLSYSVATTNSLMYMYAKLNRPDDALKVYELAKGIGLKCTVVTYGVLIKALVGSGKKQLEEKSFDILRSLPDMGIDPGIEVYNQFLEHYARTHDYRQTKTVLRVMSQAKPRCRPDAVSYGYLITCFAESKKPRSALTVFHQMRKRGIAPNGYTYMGVLKALSHMRDGISAVQVIGEMRDKGVIPDKRHYAMAMFACVTSGQCSLAESVFTLYVRMGEKPDAALYTLFLRALLQQGKWAEGMQLFRRMLTGKAACGRPNHHTLNTLLQYQVVDGHWSEALKTLDLVLMFQKPPSRERQPQPQTPPSFTNSAGNADSDNGSGSGPLSAQSIVSDANPEFSELYILARKLFQRNRRALFASQGGHAPSMSGTFLALATGLGSYSSQLKRMQKEDVTYQPHSLGAGVTATSMAIPSLSSPAAELLRPSPAALEFLVLATEALGLHDQINFQAEVYLELLQACIMEGQPLLARRLLKQRADGNVRLRDDDNQKVRSIEDLARRALKSPTLGLRTMLGHAAEKTSPTNDNHHRNHNTNHPQSLKQEMLDVEEVVSTLEDLAVDSNSNNTPTTNVAKVAAANLAVRDSIRAKKPSSAASTAVIVLEDFDMDSTLTNGDATATATDINGPLTKPGPARRRDNTKTTKTTTTTSASKGKKMSPSPPPQPKVSSSRKDDRKLMEEDNEINA